VGEKARNNGGAKSREGVLDARTESAIFRDAPQITERLKEAK